MITFDLKADIKAKFKDGNSLSAILLYEKTHIHSTEFCGKIKPNKV